MIPSGDIATRILARLKLPLTPEGFSPIRAPPWTEDYGWDLAATVSVDTEPVDLPFFEDAA